MLTMHRNDHLGLDQVMHCLDVRPVGVARHVITAGLVINDINTFFRELVHDPNDAALIAGDRLGRKKKVDRPPSS